MELKKLDQSFYTDNTVIKQALDFDMETYTWSNQKARGHGVVKIYFNNLVFAIPARSFIKHDACFLLEINRENNDIRGMGLDYSKALLIKDAKHVSTNVFILKSKHAGKKLIGKEFHITKQFNKYVSKYIGAVNNNDTNITRCSTFH